MGDAAWEKRVYPAGGDGEEVVLLQPGKPFKASRGDGSSGQGHGRNWAVQGQARTAFKVIYDPEAGTVVCELEP